MRGGDDDDDGDENCSLFSQDKAARSSTCRVMTSYGMGQFPFPILCSKHGNEGIFYQAV